MAKKENTTSEEEVVDITDKKVLPAKYEELRLKIKKKRESDAKKAEAERLRLEKEIKEDNDKINKRNKTHIISLSEFGEKGIQWIDTGIPDLNKALSGDAENGGWPRGRFIELYGPEGHGKTWVLSRTYAACAEKGLKCLHYDAERTYSKSFAALHKVDPLLLKYSDETNAEKVMDEIESFCMNNEFDVIGIDSLFALVPKRTRESEMGKEDYSPLAKCISMCIPRVSSVLAKSKTVLILVNQLRDSIGKYGESEHTPGGRTIKFFASVRIDARKKSIKKEDRPEMFENGRSIAHVLHIKTTKNKVYEPFHDCLVDVWYKKERRIIQIIKEAIEKDVIIRQRAKTSGALRGNTLTYMEKTCNPPIQYDADFTFHWLKANGLLCNLLVDMEIEDFDEFIGAGDLTEDEIVKYFVEIEKETK